MAMSKFKVDVSIRHIWFIKLINIPLVMFGLEPYVPEFCMVVSKPYSTKPTEGL